VATCYRHRVSSRSFDELLERVRALEPDIALAAKEVDHDLIDWFSTLTPRQRIDRAGRMAFDLERLRRARRTD
jgi:hypothetical protein